MFYSHAKDVNKTLNDEAGVIESSVGIFLLICI